jgi:hypothetical protein
MRVCTTVCVPQPCSSVLAADVLQWLQVWWLVDQPCGRDDMTHWALLPILHVAPVRPCMTVAAVQQVLIISHQLFVSAEVGWFFEVCQHDGLL